VRWRAASDPPPGDNGGVIPDCGACPETFPLFARLSVHTLAIIKFAARGAPATALRAEKLHGAPACRLRPSALTGTVDVPSVVYGEPRRRGLAYPSSFLQVSVPRVYFTTPPAQSDNVLQPYCNRTRTELNRGEKSVAMKWRKRHK
jgi:hypothetical protein